MRDPRTRTVSTSIFLLASITVLMGCGAVRAPVDSVATIGDQVLHFRDFQAFLDRSVGSGAEGLESPVMSALFDQFIEERLLLRLAKDEGVDVEGASDRQVIEELLQLQAPTEESESLVQDYYLGHRDQFQLPERVELLQILVEDREAAEAARAELAAGADFSEVARRISVDPSAPYGGYQGELARDDLPVALADSIFSLEERQVSDILEADYGFHLFYVARRLGPRTIPLEEARPDIEQKLRRGMVDRSLETLLEDARERYNVSIRPGRLPFDYMPSALS